MHCKYDPSQHQGPLTAVTAVQAVHVTTAGLGCFSIHVPLPITLQCAVRHLSRVL